MKNVLILISLLYMSSQIFAKDKLGCPQEEIQPTVKSELQNQQIQVEEILRYDRKMQKIKARNEKRLKRWRERPSGGNPSCLPGWTKCW